MPLNFTRNRHRTTGVEGWRGDNKLDNSKYTLAANVYPKLNQDVTNNFKRTFGKSRPIKHIRKGRYNYENNNERITSFMNGNKKIVQKIVFEKLF